MMNSISLETFLLPYIWKDFEYSNSLANVKYAGGTSSKSYL